MSGKRGAAGCGARARLALAACLALALVLIFLLWRAAARRYEAYLGGLWTGEPAFLARAGLRAFELFLGPKAGGRRPGYLLMVDAHGAALADGAIELLEGRPPPGAALRAAFCARDAFQAGAVEVRGGAPLPPRLEMAVSLAEGTLTLFGPALAPAGGRPQVHAFLLKDLPASAATLAAYASAP